MTTRHLLTIAAWSIVLGFCFSNLGFASETPAPASPVTDIALGEGGALNGQIVDPQGIPQANVQVSLQDTQNHQIAAIPTDQQGRFTITNVRGGVYQIVTPQSRGIYRVWAPGMAPPSAQPGTLIVAGQDAVRGAPPTTTGKFWLGNPLVVGGIIATAVAVPVAVVSTRSHNDPSSP